MHSVRTAHIWHPFLWSVCLSPSVCLHSPAGIPVHPLPCPGTLACFGGAGPLVVVHWAGPQLSGRTGPIHSVDTNAAGLEQGVRSTQVGESMPPHSTVVKSHFSFIWHKWLWHSVNQIS